jgi:hypothetical protein
MPPWIQDRYQDIKHPLTLIDITQSEQTTDYINFEIYKYGLEINKCSNIHSITRHLQILQINQTICWKNI